MKNQWTTIFGILAAAGKAAESYGTGIVSQIGGVVTMVALFLLGGSAKDAATKS